MGYVKFRGCICHSFCWGGWKVFVRPVLHVDPFRTPHSTRRLKDTHCSTRHQTGTASYAWLPNAADLLGIWKLVWTIIISPDVASTNHLSMRASHHHIVRCWKIKGLSDGDVHLEGFTRILLRKILRPWHFHILSPDMSWFEKGELNILYFSSPISWKWKMALLYMKLLLAAPILHVQKETKSVHLLELEMFEQIFP